MFGPSTWVGISLLSSVRTTALGLLDPVFTMVRAAPTPKATDGKPDLSGSWESEPGYFQDLAKDLKPGDVVMQPWAKTLQAQREGKDHQDDIWATACRPAFRESI